MQCVEEWQAHITSCRRRHRRNRADSRPRGLIYRFFLHLLNSIVWFCPFRNLGIFSRDASRSGFLAVCCHWISLFPYWVVKVGTFRVPNSTRKQTIQKNEDSLAMDWSCFVLIQVSGSEFREWKKRTRRPGFGTIETWSLQQGREETLRSGEIGTWSDNLYGHDATQNSYRRLTTCARLLTWMRECVQVCKRVMSNSIACLESQRSEKIKIYSEQTFTEYSARRFSRFKLSHPCKVAGYPICLILLVLYVVSCALCFWHKFSVFGFRPWIALSFFVCSPKLFAAIERSDSIFVKPCRRQPTCEQVYRRSECTSLSGENIYLLNKQQCKQAIYIGNYTLLL